MKTIGERIKYFREKRGLSQCELARLARVGQSRISEWESGVQVAHGMGVARAARIAQHLGVTLDRLVGDGHEEGSA